MRLDALVRESSLREAPSDLGVLRGPRRSDPNGGDLAHSGREDGTSRKSPAAPRELAARDEAPSQPFGFPRGRGRDQNARFDPRGLRPPSDVRPHASSLAPPPTRSPYSPPPRWARRSLTVAGDRKAARPSLRVFSRRTRAGACVGLSGSRAVKRQPLVSVFRILTQDHLQEPAIL